MDKTVKVISAEFPSTLERQARIAAAQRGISRSELIRRATHAYLRSLRQEAIKREVKQHEA